MPKTRDIQYHYYNNRNRNIINISGNCGEIVRNFYGNQKINDFKNLALLTELNNYKYVNNEIKKWVEESRNFAKEHNIPLSDLFYWEQRVGNWGTLYSFEQDIAIEEFCPFNNKEILLAFFCITSEMRKYPDYKFLKKLINSLWSETLIEPINPVYGIKPRLKSILKEFIYSHYQLRKVIHMMKH